MTFAKRSAALALAGLMTIAAATPSFAQRRWVPWAAAGASFAAGAAIGSAAAAAAANARYYEPGYGYGYGAYAYQPDTYGYGAYAYQPDTYVYSSGPYYRSGEFGHYDSGYKDCATDGQYNRTDYSAC